MMVVGQLQYFLQLNKILSYLLVDLFFSSIVSDTVNCKSILASSVFYVNVLKYKSFVLHLQCL